MLNRYEDTKWVCDVKPKKGFYEDWGNFFGLSDSGDIRNTECENWEWEGRRLQHEGGYPLGSEFDDDLSRMTYATI